MPKSWLPIGSTVISLLSVVFLHLTTHRQPVTSPFQSSLRSVTSELPLALPGEDDSSLAIADGHLPTESDYTAMGDSAAAAVTLSPQDAAAARPASPAPFTELRGMVSTYSFVRDSPFWMIQVGQPGPEVEGLRPILKHSFATIGFRADDQAIIQRYANRSQLPQAETQGQYFDPTVVALLAGQRRVVNDTIAPDDTEPDAGLDNQATSVGEDLPRWQQEVAPGGGKYWTEDPNAAWW